MPQEPDYQKFCARKFSGRDLLTIMDEAGIGVGSTIELVMSIDRMLEDDRRRPGKNLYRPWDYPPPRERPPEEQ